MIATFHQFEQFKVSSKYNVLQLIMKKSGHFVAIFDWTETFGPIRYNPIQSTCHAS